MATTTAKTEITATAIYRVTTKGTGEECYAIPSDSHPGEFYKTCWNAQAASWTCTCKAGEIAAARGKTATCKHTRAAQVAIVARKNQEREEAERKQAERERYLEYEFQCGTYNHPWN